MLSEVILDRVRRWRYSPLLFTTDCIEMESPIPGVPPGPSEQQLKLLSIFGTPEHKKITIRSGHGTGKDTSASWCILQFFMTRPDAKVVCTAPTGRQLSDILWSELSKWIRASNFADDVVIQKDKIFHKDNPKGWWIRAVSCRAKATKEEQSEAIAGFHGKHLLIVIDEASGIPEPVFTPLEGALTQEDNHVLLIGNMTKSNGYFYDTHYHPEISKLWTQLHWDSEKSSNVSQAMIDYFAMKYGKESNVYRIRVKGEPPLEDEEVFIPLSWSMQCVGNEIPVSEDEPLYLGVDVARYGDDSSIILPRRGLKIEPWSEFKGMNTIDVAGHVKLCFQEEDAEGIAVDEIGIGAGVTDWLLKHLGPAVVFGVNTANSSSNKKEYNKLRDELWTKVREKCQKGLFSFPDVEVKSLGANINIGHELCNELAIPRYDFNADGGFIVESKKKIKARGKHSPNIADALCLSEYFHDTAFTIWNKSKKVNKKKKRFNRITKARTRGWMAA